MTGIVGMRLAASIGLLIGLGILEQLAGSLFPYLVAILLIVVPVIQWATVFFFARRLDAHPEIDALRARVQDAVALSLASTVAGLLGLLFVFRALGIIAKVDGTIFLIGLSYVFLMVAAPAVNWLVTWQPWRADS